MKIRFRSGTYSRIHFLAVRIHQEIGPRGDVGISALYLMISAIQVVFVIVEYNCVMLNSALFGWSTTAKQIKKLRIVAQLWCVIR